MSEFDAILGGAGHNSLACAAHPASKGWKVAIFEANATEGGAVRTSELTLPGFRPDFGAMNLSLFAGSPFHRKYANELKAAGLELVPVADCFASAFPDCHWFGVSIDLEKTVSRIPSDRRGDLARRRNRCRNRVHAGPAAYWQLSGEFSMFGRNV